MEHDAASFGNKMMWWPVVVVPTAIPAGVGAVASRHVAKTVLPFVSAAIVVNGLQGTYLHLRRREAAARRLDPLQHRGRAADEHKHGICHEACGVQMHTGAVMRTTATHQRRWPI